MSCDWSHLSVWNDEWYNYFCARQYKQLVSSVSCDAWFTKLPISRTIISKYYRLRLGHNTLPSHSFKLSLNNCSACIFLKCMGFLCDFHYIVSYCPALNKEREDLRDVWISLHINMNPTNLLSSNLIHIIQSVIGFIHNTGLHI